MATSKSKTKTAYTDTYKDHPVIHLPIAGTEKTFCFGIKRAEAIVNNMSDVVNFVSGKPLTKATTKKWKGIAILNLAKEGKPFSFGLDKAKLIISNAGAVIDFAASNR